MMPMTARSALTIVKVICENHELKEVRDALAMVVSTFEKGEEWERLESILTNVVDPATPANRAMMNEHVIAFGRFLSARAAYKNGTPHPNSLPQPTFFDMLGDYFRSL